MTWLRCPCFDSAAFSAPRAPLRALSPPFPVSSMLASPLSPLHALLPILPLHGPTARPSTRAPSSPRASCPISRSSRRPTTRSTASRASRSGCRMSSARSSGPSFVRSCRSRSSTAPCHGRRLSTVSLPTGCRRSSAGAGLTPYVALAMLQLSLLCILLCCHACSLLCTSAYS